MKILALILLTLLFVQSYFFYDLTVKNKTLHKKYQDAVLAISYHEKKNIKMIKQVQFAENKIAKMDESITKQKIDYTELQAKTDQMKHSINQLKQKNNSQEIFAQQKDKEIIILKNELLKYLSE